jgi:PKHD-type hydroxylase
MSSVETHRFAFVFPSIRSDAQGVPVLSWEDGIQPFDAELDLDTNPEFHLVRTAVDAFTVDECERIIELGNAQPNMGGMVEDHRREEYRAGKVAWIGPQAGTAWLYHKLAVLFSEVNAYFNFELLGLLDPLQFTVYGSGHHFDWHIDVGGGAASLRKLSMTVQLTDGARYEGGDLQFHDDTGRPQRRGIGTATVFPSFIAHRVTPVTAGVRHSLVAWACGPSFR